MKVTREKIDEIEALFTSIDEEISWILYDSADEGDWVVKLLGVVESAKQYVMSELLQATGDK